MNWDELPDDVKTAIDDHLTVLQAQAFVLALYGLSLGQIARAMSVTPATARDHVHAAVSNLIDAGVHIHPNGHPYTREHT